MLEYKFFPDSYNYTLIKNKGINLENFLKLQIKYKNDFEKILIGIIDFKKIDNYIDGFEKKIPIITDHKYNFYHKYSLLGSKYIFFRNNIHIENLSLDEIEVINTSIVNNVSLEYKFLIDTFEKVLYENGDIAMFGIPIESNEVLSQSLVFEFAYNQKEFSTIEQYYFVNNIKDELLRDFNNLINKVIDVDVSVICYNCIPDIYSKENLFIKVNLEN